MKDKGARLEANRDAHGDLAPPWEEFPTYERYSMGWRMGSGEDWLRLWHVFLEELEDRDARLAYLRRHAPAPFNWANAVANVISEDEGEEDGEADGEEDEDIDYDALLAEGLIASDIAYPTWLAKQRGVVWPWSYADDPIDAARHYTRECSFWSRQVEALRADPAWTPPSVPPAWEVCAEALATGRVRDPEPARGLVTLARMLAAGHVAPPWTLGLGPSDFADTFELTMGYADAFRLWGMSVFDDEEHLARYLGTSPPPASWQAWITEHLPFT
jgi:hypothetical protein